MERDLAIEFQTIIKTIIAPLLKESGFKKNNLNFNRTINELVQSINIQRSQYNHVERVLFTVNFGFYNSLLFQISRDKNQEPKFVTSDNCFAWGRSGHLIYNHDHWYELNLAKDYDEVSHQIEIDLKKHIIPLFNKLHTLDSLIELLRIDSKNRPFHLTANIDDISVLELEYGDFEKGTQIIREVHNKAIVPTSTKHTTIYPDGKQEVRWSEPSINSYHIEKLERIAKKYKIDL